MNAFFPLALTAPWALLALPLLPLLWWLLRVVPPPPRRVRFPAINLLFGLSSAEEDAARTPWWVLALRLALAVLVILAAAGPVWQPVQGLGGNGPLLLVVDDSWAAARDWTARRDFLDGTLARAERDGRPVMLLPTAPPPEGGPVQVSPPMSAAQARPLVAALAPKPWPADRAGALAALRALPRDTVLSVLWLADGIGDDSVTALARALQSLGGGVEMVTGRTARVLSPPKDGAARDRVEVPLRRLPAGPEPLALRALDGDGRVVARTEIMLADGQDAANVVLTLPADLRNRLTRLEIEGEDAASATVLLDPRWRRRLVGLAGAEEGGAPLLAQMTYVERALAPIADVRRGDVGELLNGEMAVLMLADGPPPPAETAARLERWVAEGGVLVRFAGPLLARAAGTAPPDPLLPVRLRGGGRSLGGAMSWTAPQSLAPFAEDGPFAGLSIPAEVTVTSQVLAEPGLDLSDRTWARLTDGTPLVTGARKGKGWLVLVHTTANTGWSTLPLSGLFVDMLKRLVELSAGDAAPRAAGPLPPDRVLDGFGRLGTPGAAATALPPGESTMIPGPRHPPGLYGPAGNGIALNLGPALGRLSPLEPPSGILRTTLDGRGGETDLRGPLLVAALLLALADMVLALRLRGLLALAALVLLAIPPRADAADAPRSALQTRLAYVRTGDATIDSKSAAGLAELSKLVDGRSTAALTAPVAVDVEHDTVLFYPLLYWPVTAAQAPPGAAAVEKLNAYMRTGGLIVFDSQGADDAEALRRLTAGLAIPPLAPVTDEHVLTRSFYLLKEMPGRLSGGTVWAADGQSQGNDGVSPVVIGGGDWAGAWAAGNNGDRQRELAFRFGINLVMYALTGNYKADQVHIPAIMERLGR